MDTSVPREVELLQRIVTPLRIPTATWLLCDVFGYVDAIARRRLSDLIADGWLVQRPGGVVYAPLVWTNRRIIV